MTRIAVRLVCLAMVVGAGAGCSKQARVGQLSGKVTFKGRPVRAGYISFTPNSSEGNLGKVKVAQIRDGAYDTAREADPGLSPGPTIIRVAGFDGKPLPGFAQGKQIFNPYEVQAAVPDGTSTMDFTIPVSAAENLRIEPTADLP
jgi:hypothetical protein